MSGCVGGPLSIQGEDGAVPSSVGTSGARELAWPGDTQHTGTPRPCSAATGHWAATARAHGGLGELTGFGRGQLLGRLFSLLGKRPLFVILPLFAASRARLCLLSGAHRLHRLPGLPYPPAPAAPQRCPALGQPETALWHAAPAGVVGCYRGIEGCTGLGNRPCRPSVRWHCLLVPIRSTPALPFGAVGWGALCSPTPPFSPSPLVQPAQPR